jgi:hypothetical protein
VTFRALRADPVSEFPDASSTVVIRFSTASSMRCKRGRRGLPSTFFGISVGTALTLAGILTQELDDDAHAVFVAHATWCHATPTLARAAVAPRTAADRRSRKRTRAGNLARDLRYALRDHPKVTRTTVAHSFLARSARDAEVHHPTCSSNDARVTPISVVYLGFAESEASVRALTLLEARRLIQPWRSRSRCRTSVIGTKSSSVTCKIGMPGGDHARCHHRPRGPSRVAGEPCMLKNVGRFHVS